jgi:hypothetical protein
LAHPALVTLAQELAALGPALVPLIAEDDRFLTLEWHGGGLSHPMLSGTDFWSISTGNVEIEAEPYVAAFPAPVEIGARAQAAFDATGIAMRWHFADDDALDLALARRLPVLAPMVTYARDGTIEVQTNDDGGSEARREPDLACWSGPLPHMTGRSAAGRHGSGTGPRRFPAGPEPEAACFPTGSSPELRCRQDHQGG